MQNRLPMEPAPGWRSVLQDCLPLFSIWSKPRLFENVFYTLANAASSTRRGALVLDTSFVKNVHGSDVLGPNPTDRGRNGSKVSLLTDSKGTPLCAVLHKANKNDALTICASPFEQACLMQIHVSYFDFPNEFSEESLRKSYAGPCIASVLKYICDRLGRHISL